MKVLDNEEAGGGLPELFWWGTEGGSRVDSLICEAG